MKNEHTLSEQKMSHAFIVASPDIELREKKAFELACKLLCERREIAPCFECPQCKKALAGIHPDLITVERLIDDKGKQKRELVVEQIRALTADAWVRPGQADKKVYLIRDAGFMNTAAQNAALKLLEEPPAHAAFILCAESAEALLATIRSRCVTIRVTGEKTRVENEFATKYISIAAKRDMAALCAFCSRCEAEDTEHITELINAIRLSLGDIVCQRSTNTGLSRPDAVRLLPLCERAAEYLRLNVGAKHVLGLLCARTI
ncbi:MAG: hypothetical protein RR743_02560 [Oscillospiraceae bacterium]